MRRAAFAVVTLLATAASAAPPIYLWLEADWFRGIEGTFSYSTGRASAPGHFGIAGPGISAEWSQGGDSEWNAMGAPASETRAVAFREIVVPRAGKYRLWVRYVDHLEKTEPFVVAVAQGGRVVRKEMGVLPVVPPADEYQLYFGFSYGWADLALALERGPARITLSIERAGEGFRKIDALLLTDDLGYRPVAREKPPFGYLESFALRPEAGTAWRGSAAELHLEPSARRAPLGGVDFSLLSTSELHTGAVAEGALDTLSLYDLFFASAPVRALRAAFAKQFAGRSDLPIVSSPRLRPGFYLDTPDLSPGTPLRRFLERTRTPFFILTNYARPKYTKESGPLTYAALIGPLRAQFLGFIHGEALGPPGSGIEDRPLAVSRRAHLDAFGKQLVESQIKLWSEIFHTPVGPELFALGIPCLSSDLANALSHDLHRLGARTVGYEEDSTEVHVPLRLAFQRGAARQFGGNFINYASSNFGDAANSFGPDPVVNRGALGWYHSKYSPTDGVSASWYRKLYYLNYLGGASAIFWEQGLHNQFMQPGPGPHPIELSPFGRVTVEFERFLDRLPDRGEPYTPIAILLGYGHGYERASYRSRIFEVFDETPADLELRELFNVFFHPSGVVEGLPAAPDIQSMPNGVYGNLFDVLVDRPERLQAIFDYPIVWAAGEVALGGANQKVIAQYLERGGTLVVNATELGQLPPSLTALRPTGKRLLAESFTLEGGAPRSTTPFEVAEATITGPSARVLARADGAPLLVRTQVGKGALLTLLVPHAIGLDERAHPILPYLMNGLTDQLLPVEVRLPSGARPQGEIMYQLNRTQDGWLVMLINNRGIDKTQSGIARVDRREAVEVVLHAAWPIGEAREYTEGRTLSPTGSELRVRVEPGGVQVVGLRAR